MKTLLKSGGDIFSDYVEKRGKGLTFDIKKLSENVKCKADPVGICFKTCVDMYVACNKNGHAAAHVPKKPQTIQ